VLAPIKASHDNDENITGNPPMMFSPFPRPTLTSTARAEANKVARAAEKRG
jgi:hypothetical protein